MKLLAAFLILCSAATANTCVLAAGTYATLASTSTHWTGAGCTGAYVAGNGDTANLGTNSAVLTVAAAETWTIGTSPVSGTAATILGTGGLLNISGTVLQRGDITSGAGSSTAVDVKAGGTLKFDATQNLGNFYVYNPSGHRTFNFSGTAGSCAFNGYRYTGATCATLTSDLTGGALAGGLVGSDPSGAISGSYGAISNLGTASRTAIFVKELGFNTAVNFTLDHVSFANIGLVQLATNVNVSLTNFAFRDGLNSQDEGEDLEIFESSNPVTRVLRDGVFSSGKNFKIISPVTWIWQRLYMNPPSLSSATGSGSSTCNGFLMPTASADFGFPCTTQTYLMMLKDVTGTTGHLLSTASTGPAGTTVNISYLYGEFPDADSGSNQGKLMVTNGSQPASPTQVNVSNVVLPCNKSGVGNSELVGGAGSVSTANNLLTVTHATACVQSGGGGSQFTMIDEGGAADNTLNFEANIMYAPGGAFYKSISATVASPSTNTIKTADYNAAGSAFTATNAGCPNCTQNGGSGGGLNGWTHKCTTAAGVTCPSGVHDIGPTSPGFANQNYKWATWATLGPPAQLICPDWVTNTDYTYDANSPTCVSVSNAGVYGSVSVNYRLLATHKSAAGTKPDSGASWRTDWEYDSNYQMRTSTVNASTFTVGSTNGLYTAEAFWAWVGTGLIPSASSYRFTFPGDTNAVTNVGAFQMGSGNAPRLRTVMMQ